MAATPASAITLVDNFTKGVAAALSAQNKDIAEKLAQQSVILGTILARVEALDAAMATMGTAAPAKRAVRATAAGKPAAKKAGGSKVTNTLLYFRHAMETDLNEARATYLTDDNLAAAAADATVAKKDITKDEGAYYSAVGNFIWKTLTEAQKEEIRAEFTAWKSANEHAAADATQLEEDQEAA